MPMESSGPEVSRQALLTLAPFTLPILILTVTSGFDAFHGKLDDTLCRWGLATDEHVREYPPLSMNAGELVCASVPQPIEGGVPVSIALFNPNPNRDPWP